MKDVSGKDVSVLIAARQPLCLLICAVGLRSDSQSEHETSFSPLPLLSVSDYFSPPQRKCRVFSKLRLGSALQFTTAVRPVL